MTVFRSTVYYVLQRCTCMQTGEYLSYINVNCISKMIHTCDEIPMIVLKSVKKWLKNTIITKANIILKTSCDDPKNKIVNQLYVIL